MARLAELGVPVEWEDVARRAQGKVGRPHIAAALVAAGHVATVQEAFDRYLDSSAPAYVDAGSLTGVEATQLVTASGGAAVLAHPDTLRLDDAALDVYVAELARAGLRGLEVFRPDHDWERRAFYGSLCERYGLVPAGGSDYHRSGEEKGLEPGSTGSEPLPPDTLERLLPALP